MVSEWPSLSSLRWCKTSLEGHTQIPNTMTTISAIKSQHTGNLYLPITTNLFQDFNPEITRPKTTKLTNLHTSPK
jgi:hypothetical protein